MKNLIFDLDGVIITYKKNFAEIYSEEFGVPVNEIYKFFSDDYYHCAIGKSSLSGAIEKYIPKWKWPGNAETLMRYWFDCQNSVNLDLIKLIKNSKPLGNKCYIASDQDSIRVKYIRNLFDFESVFDGFFFSCEIGATKIETAFFEKVIDSLNCSPGDIYFWDDSPKNIAKARETGINAELYTAFEDFHSSFSATFCSAS